MKNSKILLARIIVCDLSLKLCFFMAFLFITPIFLMAEIKAMGEKEAVKEEIPIDNKNTVRPDEEKLIQDFNSGHFGAPKFKDWLKNYVDVVPDEEKNQFFMATYNTWLLDRNKIGFWDQIGWTEDNTLESPHAKERSIRIPYVIQSHYERKGKKLKDQLGLLALQGVWHKSYKDHFAAKFRQMGNYKVFYNLDLGKKKSLLGTGLMTIINGDFFEVEKQEVCLFPSKNSKDFKKDNYVDRGFHFFELKLKNYDDESYQSIYVFNVNFSPVEIEFEKTKMGKTKVREMRSDSTHVISQLRELKKFYYKKLEEKKLPVVFLGDFGRDLVEGYAVFEKNLSFIEKGSSSFEVIETGGEIRRGGYQASYDFRENNYAKYRFKESKGYNFKNASEALFSPSSIIMNKKFFKNEECGFYPLKNDKGRNLSDQYLYEVFFKF